MSEPSLDQVEAHESRLVAQARVVELMQDVGLLGEILDAIPMSPYNKFEEQAIEQIDECRRVLTRIEVLVHRETRHRYAHADSKAGS